jgi:hypothetical protein
LHDFVEKIYIIEQIELIQHTFNGNKSCSEMAFYFILFYSFFFKIT